MYHRYLELDSHPSLMLKRGIEGELENIEKKNGKISSP